MVPVVKPISTIACHNRAETMAFAMTQSPAIPANAHPVTLDSRAKQISTTANHHHATEAHASMVTIHSHVNAMQVTPANCAKLKSMNANQVRKAIQNAEIVFIQISKQIFTNLFPFNQIHANSKDIAKILLAAIVAVANQEHPEKTVKSM